MIRVTIEFKEEMIKGYGEIIFRAEGKIGEVNNFDLVGGGIDIQQLKRDDIKPPQVPCAVTIVREVIE